MTETIAAWDFRRGLCGWQANAGVVRTRVTPDGIALTVKGPDPFLTSPPIGKAAGPFVVVVLTMRSTGDPIGQIYYGAEFSEAQSVPFAIRNDGRWREVRVTLPALESGARLRLDPCHTSGEVGVASLRVEAHASAPRELWASPAELRGKRLIGAGQYANYGGEQAVTSRYLARHPEFLARYPFDGIVLSVPVPAAVVARYRLDPGEYRLQNLLWTPLGLDDAAFAEARADLKAVRWGHVTDNFLNVTMSDATDGKRLLRLDDDRDWAAVEANFAAAARLCRAAGLTGIWLDTEQYGNYQSSGDKFPLGRDSAAVLRRRGAQWIRAIQRELPAVQILVTFAWSPDADGYGPLKGATPFLNGVLDAIQAPGAIHHTYENTFYFGQGPGTLYAASDGKANGYPGGRARFETAVASIRSWRSLSGNPAKYDRVVKTGMAAWVEDDPWNAWGNEPGLSWSLWSNAALALAYSEKYVWVWSEHTHYAHGLAAGNGVNPFLASLTNQTFNTGREAAVALAEDFATDPLRRGWHFDFDMLAIARKTKPEHAMPTMSPEALPYAWEPKSRSVRVRGDAPAGLPTQRRRFVHPVRPSARFAARFDLRIETLPRDPANPIRLGLFAHGAPVDRQSVSILIRAADSVWLSVADRRARLPLAAPLVPGRTYGFTLTRGTAVDAVALGGAVVIGRARLPKGAGAAALDEFGVALDDTGAARPGAAPDYAYQLLYARIETS